MSRGCAPAVMRGRAHPGRTDCGRRAGGRAGRSAGTRVAGIPRRDVGPGPRADAFMESREARRAVKDAAKKEAETADPQIAADLQPSGERTAPASRCRALANDERHGTCRCTCPLQHLAHAPARGARARCASAGSGSANSRPNSRRRVREATANSWSCRPSGARPCANAGEQMSPEERRRAIQRRQGPKPGTVDKRPCPPC